MAMYSLKWNFGKLIQKYIKTDLNPIVMNSFKTIESLKVAFLKYVFKWVVEIVKELIFDLLIIV
jgi:hypothetical protein